MAQKTAAKETTIQITEGEETAVVRTTDKDWINKLTKLDGVEREDDGGITYFAVDPNWIIIGEPRVRKERAARPEMTVEQKSITKARLVMARAAKNPEWAKNNAELVAKWAAAEPEMQEKYFPEYSVNGKTKTKATTKASAKRRAPDPAPEPEPEEPEEEEEEGTEEPEPAPAPAGRKKSGLAGRLRASR